MLREKGCNAALRLADEREYCGRIPYGHLERHAFWGCGLQVVENPGFLFYPMRPFRSYGRSGAFLNIGLVAIGGAWATKK